MERLTRWILLLVLLAVVAGGGYVGWQRYGASSPEVIFRTAQVEQGDLVATISATGTIEPEEVIDVGAQVAAQIRNFGPDPNDAKKTIDYGSRVHENTLLAQLDDSLFKARVDQMQASLEEAKSSITQAEAGIKKAEADLVQLRSKAQQADRDWERAKQLAVSRNIAPTEYDAAQANYETTHATVGVGEASLNQARVTKVQAEKTLGRMEASLQEARVNLGYTQIRSPVEGVILDRRVNVGQTVVAGLNAPSLFLIAKDLRRLEVWASVNEADIGAIKPGQTVRFNVDAYPKQSFLGKVAQVRLNASMTQNVVTYTVVVSTDNSDEKLLPYMTANMRFETARRDSSILVPNAALRWKPRPNLIHPDVPKGKSAKDTNEEGTVWIPDGNFVRPVPVKIGLSDGVQTEIVGGDLQPGQSLVIGSVRPNQKGDAGGGTNPFAPKMFGGKKS